MCNRSVDEIGITGILEKHSALSACDEIEIVLNRFFNSYIEDRKNAKRSAYNEFNVMLSIALQNTDDYDSKLSKEVQRLIQTFNEEAAN